MKGWLAPLLTVTLLVSGCTTPRNPSTPARAPSPVVANAEPAPAPEPEPEPQPQPEPLRLVNRLESESLCGADLPVAEREQALMTNLPALLNGRTAQELWQEVAAEVTEDWNKYKISHSLCIDPRQVGDYDALLFTTSYGKGGWAAILATHTGAQWQLAPVRPPEGGWQFMDYIYVGQARFPEGKPDLILVGGTSGTAGYKAILRGRLDQAGNLQLEHVSGGFAKSNIEFLGSEWVLATYRGKELGPVLWDCNACLPTNHQILLQWNGDKYASVGTRIVSTPKLTANLFWGAIRAGDDQLAQQYAADRSVVETARTLWDSGRFKGSIHWDGSHISEIEFHNWDLLPPAFRQSLPADLMTYSMELGSGLSQEMRRTPEGWVLTDIAQTSR